MESVESQNIETPHERRPFRAHGQMDVVTLGDFTLGKGTFEPGWRWSEDVKPIAGTDYGTEATVGPGDVVRIEPGHDAWVEGDEPCVLYDTGVAAYAKPR